MQTDAHKHTHAHSTDAYTQATCDPARFASLLGSHEQRVSTERGSSRRRDLRRGRTPGESAVGDEPSRRAATSGRAWQVHARAGPHGASSGPRGGWRGGGGLVFDNLQRRSVF